MKRLFQLWTAGLSVAGLLMWPGAAAAEEPAPVREKAQPCKGRRPCEGRNTLVKDIRILQHNGARAHWAPSSDMLVFDRRNRDGFADLYLSDLQGRTTALTEGKPGIAQRNNGNGIFHPSGDFIVFVSEEAQHAFSGNKIMGDPGLGLFSNLWATDRTGSRFWKLTEIPVRKRTIERTPVYGSVNPRFTPDGSKLVWTERYDNGGRWGKWRLKWADFSVNGGEPRTANESVLYTPSRGNYVTAMGFVGRRILVAGNLEGQHEYGMDLYLLDPSGGQPLNLVKTRKFWEEGACVSPRTRSVVFMSNAASRYEMDFDDENWGAQLEERDYWITDPDGKTPERLTWFTEPGAPEYLGGRSMVAVCGFSPDGRYLAGTLGIDRSPGRKRNLLLKIVLVEFRRPL